MRHHSNCANETCLPFAERSICYQPTTISNILICSAKHIMNGYSMLCKPFSIFTFKFISRQINFSNFNSIEIELVAGKVTEKREPFARVLIDKYSTRKAQCQKNL